MCLSLCGRRGLSMSHLFISHIHSEITKERQEVYICTHKPWNVQKVILLDWSMFQNLELSGSVYFWESTVLFVYITMINLYFQ